MLSNQLYDNFALVLRAPEILNVTPIRYNKTKRSLECESSNSLFQKICFIFIVTCLESFAHVIQAIILWNQRELDIMNQLIAFRFGSLVMFVALSIPTFLSKELAEIVNDHFIFFRHLQCK